MSYRLLFHVDVRRFAASVGPTAPLGSLSGPMSIVLWTGLMGAMRTFLSEFAPLGIGSRLHSLIHNFEEGQRTGMAIIGAYEQGDRPYLVQYIEQSWPDYIIQQARTALSQALQAVVPEIVDAIVQATASHGAVLMTNVAALSMMLRAFSDEHSSMYRSLFEFLTSIELQVSLFQFRSSINPSGGSEDGLNARGGPGSSRDPPAQP